MIILVRAYNAYDHSSFFKIDFNWFEYKLVYIIIIKILMRKCHVTILFLISLFLGIFHHSIMYASHHVVHHDDNQMMISLLGNELIKFNEKF
jgi:hypothetical protein